MGRTGFFFSVHLTRPTPGSTRPTRANPENPGSTQFFMVAKLRYEDIKTSDKTSD